ncbi:MAG: hypothetical protein RL318_1279 [Fibrobacterota bacterium]|jgi:uncharacterized protein (TIGR02147 family)
MDSPSVYTYNDFRAYLADWQVWKQKSDPSFSRSEFSRRLGLPRTRSFLNDVLGGKTVTSTFIDRFVQAMDLPRDEAQFFRCLVKFNQAASPSDRELCYEQLIQLNRSPKAVLDRDAWDYYKDWHHAALRCALDVLDWDGQSPASLGRKLTPRFTAGEVKTSFELLKRMGMIEANGSGFWKPTQKVLSTGDGVRDARVLQHQLQCLELVSEAMLADLPPGARDTSALFLSVSVEAEGLLRKRMSHFRSELRSIVHKDTQPATRVLHLGIQLIPLLTQEISA